MKQIWLTLGLLILAMLAFYWVNNRYLVGERVEPVVSNKEIYFKVPEKIAIEVETDIDLVAKYEVGKVVNFLINFNFDPSKFKIINIEVNKEIFDGDNGAEIDENFGKVMIKGDSTNKKEGEEEVGEIKLATIKIRGIKKGESMIYASRRPEIGGWDGKKVIKENFQMPNFKINFL